jgi:hypothetical protein
MCVNSKYYILKYTKYSMYDVCLQCLRNDLNSEPKTNPTVEQKKTIDTLMRGLVQTDNELAEAQRKVQRYQTREGIQFSVYVLYIQFGRV